MNVLVRHKAGVWLVRPAVLWIDEVGRGAPIDVIQFINPRGSSKKRFAAKLLATSRRWAPCHCQ